MTRLVITADSHPEDRLLDTEDPVAIAQALSQVGLTFEQWQATQPLTADESHDQILAAYAPEIDRLKAAGGYTTADVIHLTPAHSNRGELRQKFLNEHTHSEDEVRFFVAGQAVFYVHTNEQIYAVRCQQGDLLSIPANTPHWFDMGEFPEFTAIRLFANTEGWVAQWTGDKIADRFPRYEAY